MLKFIAMASGFSFPHYAEVTVFSSLQLDFTALTHRPIFMPDTSKEADYAKDCLSKVPSEKVPARD
jgi:hypothetical protein